MGPFIMLDTEEIDENHCENKDTPRLLSRTIVFLGDSANRAITKINR